MALTLQSVLGALGLDATLQAILTKLGTTLNVQSPGMNKVLVGNAQGKLRDDFVHLDTNKWETVQVGTGMSVTENGVTTRYLEINSGTTVSQETILLSKDSFSPPFKLGIGLSLSARAATNPTFYIEVVGVDDTGAVITSTEFDSPQSKNAMDCAALRFSGTGVTAAYPIVRASGGPEVVGSLQAVVTTAATGASPNFSPAGIYEIIMDTEEVTIGSRSVDSTALMGTAASKITQNVPDPNKKYKIRIRMVNGPTTVNPAITARLHFLRVIDVTRLTVDMARSQGRNDASISVPVTAVGTVTTSSFSGVGVQAIQCNRAVSLNQVLAAGGVYSDNTVNFVGWSNSTATWQGHCLDIISPTDGTLTWLDSNDGIVFYPAETYAIVAGVGRQIYRKLAAHQGRWVFTNGSTPMTAGNPLIMFRQTHLI